MIVQYCLSVSKDPMLLYHRLDLKRPNNMCFHLKQLATEGNIYMILNYTELLALV